MTVVESLEHAVEQLLSGALAEFRRWFAESDANTWDAQIDAAAAVGKLDRFAAEALAEYEAGEAEEL